MYNLQDFEDDAVLSDTAPARATPDWKKADKALFAKGRRDDDLYGIALKLKRGGMSDADVYTVLDTIATGYGETETGKGREKWLRAKILSAAKRDINKVTDISNAVDEFLEQQGLPDNDRQRVV